MTIEYKGASIEEVIISIVKELEKENESLKERIKELEEKPIEEANNG